MNKLPLPNQTSSDKSPRRLSWDKATNFLGSLQPCRPSRWCRDLRCSHCAGVHRRHFISEVILQHSRTPFELLITIGHTDATKLMAWIHLKQLGRAIAVAQGKVPGPNIRVLSMNENHYPHVHILASRAYSIAIHRRGLLGLEPQNRPHTARLWDMPINLKTDPIIDIDGIAGYLFDRNYLPTICMDTRPPRLRLLASSKGPKLGFPPRYRAVLSIGEQLI